MCFLCCKYLYSNVPPELPYTLPIQLPLTNPAVTVSIPFQEPWTTSPSHVSKLAGCDLHDPISPCRIQEVGSACH